MNLQQHTRLPHFACPVSLSSEPLWDRPLPPLLAPLPPLPVVVGHGHLIFPSHLSQITQSSCCCLMARDRVSTDVQYHSGSDKINWALVLTMERSWSHEHLVENENVHTYICIDGVNDERKKGVTKKKKDLARWMEPITPVSSLWCHQLVLFICLEWVRIYMPTYYSRTEASERNNHYPARRPYSNTAFTTRLTLPDIQSTVTIKKNLPRGERRNYSLLDTPTLLYRNQNLENESFIVMLVVGPGARLVWIGVVSLAFCSTGL